MTRYKSDPSLLVAITLTFAVAVTIWVMALFSILGNCTDRVYDRDGELVTPRTCTYGGY